MLKRLSSRGHGAAAISACLCACLAAASSAQDSIDDDGHASATANGAVVLDVPPFTLQGPTHPDPADAPAKPVDAPPASEPLTTTPPAPDAISNDNSTTDANTDATTGSTTGSNSASTTDDRAVWQPPARERQALGDPGTSNPIAGAADALTDENKKASPLAAIDPRTNDIVRVVLALSFVLGLIFTLRRFIQKKGGGLGHAGRPSGVLEVLARYPIARGQQLMVLKMGRRVMLVHHAGDNMTPITDVSDNDEVAALLARIEAGSNAKATPRFGSMLETFHKGMPATNARPANVVARDGVVDLTRRNATGGIGRLLLPRKVGS